MGGEDGIGRQINAGVDKMVEMSMATMFERPFVSILLVSLQVILQECLLVEGRGGFVWFLFSINCLQWHVADKIVS